MPFRTFTPRDVIYTGRVSRSDLTKAVTAVRYCRVSCFSVAVILRVSEKYAPLNSIDNKKKKTAKNISFSKIKLAIS